MCNLQRIFEKTSQFIDENNKDFNIFEKLENEEELKQQEQLEMIINFKPVISMYKHVINNDDFINPSILNKPDIIFKRHKNLYYLPFSITDNIINFILYNRLTKYNLNVTGNKGLFLYKNEVFGIKETSIDEIPKTSFFSCKNLIYIFLKILYNISILQKTVKFVHGNLTFSNIKMKETSVEDKYENLELYFFNDIYSENITSNSFKIKTIMDIVITDFSNSQIEYKNSVYSSYKNYNDRTNIFYNSYDYLTFIGSIFEGYLFSTNYNKENIQILKNDVSLKSLGKSKDVIFNLIFFLFKSVAPSLINEHMNQDEILCIIRSIYSKSGNISKDMYKPSLQYLYKNNNFFSPPEEVFKRIYHYLYDHNLFSDIICDFIPIKNTTSLTFKHVDSFHLTINKYINYIKLNYTKPTSPYIINHQNENCQTKQLVHYLKIDTDIFKQGKYKFISECCFNDISEFFENKKRHGVAINGSFFNIKNNPLNPVSFYKDKHWIASDISSKLDNISINFLKYYCLLCFKNTVNQKENFTFSIYSFIDKNKQQIQEEIELRIKAYDYITICGPLLLDKTSNFEFSEKDINIVVDNEQIFQCFSPEKEDKTKFFDKPNIKKCVNGTLKDFKSDFKYQTCHDIQPGNLSHGLNLNPRSAIAYSTNNNKSFIYFISIEGRSHKADGQNFLDMLETFKKIDNNIIKAVNLDGGRSSVICWKMKDDLNTFFSANNNKKSEYACGNIFGIVSE